MTDPLTGEKRLVKLGSPRRLQIIYESNMRAAHAAAQWARIQRTKAGAPYLLYEFGPSERHRPEHAARAGMIRPVDDPVWGRWFSEAASGGRWDRPELRRMIDQLRPGDVVVVWKLDRLSRSLKDLLALMEEIHAAGAQFRSLTEAIDTTTPAGRMMMQMVGAFAEFERAMIRERIRAGLEAARAEGRIGGRRRALRPDQRADIAENVLSGRKTGAQMARLYGVSQATVSRIMAETRHTRKMHPEGETL